MLCCCPVDRKTGPRQGPKTLKNGRLAKSKDNNFDDSPDLIKALILNLMI